ncbi:MAG: hypothetical protein IK025_05415 [Bacteroidales bacterium]|nr:hypothetical protein [Bacteroidales bacterium]
MAANKIITICLFLGLLFSSCSSLMFSLMGIKQPAECDLEEIIAYSDKFGIPANSSYFLDTTYLYDLLHFGNNDTILRNNLMQPLQIRFYHKTDTLLSLHLNCTAGGFPNLKWNKRGQLDTIPPKFSVSIDTCLLFSKDLKYLIPIGDNHNTDKDYTTADYNIILFWSVFMNRQSKILIREIQNYQKRFPDKKISILYVNTDNVYNRLAK